MKAIVVIAFIILPTFAQGQGLFSYSNFSAPTRIETIDGPLAGRGIWAQMLVGLTFDSLMPVAPVVEHRTNGFVAGGGIVAVPGLPGGTRAFIQMWAWDGARWGTDLAQVPADQFGKTDIVPIFLTYSFDPALPSCLRKVPSSPFPNPPLGH